MLAVKHVHGCVTCCCQTPNPLPAHMGDIIGTNCNSSFQMAGSVGFGSCVNPLTSLPLGSVSHARARCSRAVPSVSTAYPSHHVAQTAKVPVTTGTKQCGQVSTRSPLSPFSVPCCVAHPMAALYLEPSLSPFQVVAIISTCCSYKLLPSGSTVTPGHAAVRWVPRRRCCRCACCASDVRP
jgi:hypothetical protein